MEVYEVELKGLRPLLMHAPFGISDRPTRRRGEHPEPKEEAESYLYKNSEGQICIPAANIKACIRAAGRNYRVRGRGSTFGAMVPAALEIIPSMVFLVHNGWEVDIRPVVVQRQRILRARPCFNSWALKFKIRNSDPTIIPADMTKKLIIDAGKYYGLGDFRPEYGLFELAKFEIKS
jgi:hypothetical protein